MNDQFSAITPIDTANDALETVGGKGRSLAQMTRAGFDVPGGFLLSTAAYRDFVADNELGERILELARPEIIDGRAFVRVGVPVDPDAHHRMRACRRTEGRTHGRLRGASW